MAFLNIRTSALGSVFNQLLMADDIEPGSDPSYQLCKQIYTYHPLGKRLVDAPITMAQSQPREVSIPKAPDSVPARFLQQWDADGCDGGIFNLCTQARIYGIASVALVASKKNSSVPLATDKPIDYMQLPDMEIAFNIFDPLNTAGSLVGNMQTDSLGFMKTADLVVNGKRFHRSRTFTLMNEMPVYLQYTSSAYGFVGRSVYQRSLYALKSFIRTMIADEMVATKCGVLIAAMKSAGSIASGVMLAALGQKREIVKEAVTGNVINITPEERIESLDMQNVNGALEISRRNIIHNIASAADMPAIIINSETYQAGFGEGTQDAYNVARYIEGVRKDYRKVYDFFDEITMHRAWSKEFFASVQEEFPAEFGSRKYEDVFYEWKNDFHALWPSLIQEPPSEKVKVADAKMKDMIALAQFLLPEIDPENKLEVLQWLQSNFNELTDLFDTPLEMDFDILGQHVEEQAAKAEEERSMSLEAMNDPEDGGAKSSPKPISRGDAVFPIAAE